MRSIVERQAKKEEKITKIISDLPNLNAIIRPASKKTADIKDKIENVCS